MLKGIMCKKEHAHIIIPALYFSLLCVWKMQLHCRIHWRLVEYIESNKCGSIDTGNIASWHYSFDYLVLLVFSRWNRVLLLFTSKVTFFQVLFYFYLSNYFGKYFYFYLSKNIPDYLYFYLSIKTQYFEQHWLKQNSITTKKTKMLWHAL